MQMVCTLILIQFSLGLFLMTDSYEVKNEGPKMHRHTETLPNENHHAQCKLLNIFFLYLRFPLMMDCSMVYLFAVFYNSRKAANDMKKKKKDILSLSNFLNSRLHFYICLNADIKILKLFYIFWWTGFIQSDFYHKEWEPT